MKPQVITLTRRRGGSGGADNQTIIALVVHLSSLSRAIRVDPPFRQVWDNPELRVFFRDCGGDWRSLVERR